MDEAGAGEQRGDGVRRGAAQPGQLLAPQWTYFAVDDELLRSAGLLGDCLLAHDTMPAAEEEEAVPPSFADPDDTDRGEICCVCETRAQRPDVRAFACAAEHTEAICGTCTATIVARGGGCPMCRAPVLGWVAALRN